jgi:hypothetical protein
MFFNIDTRSPIVSKFLSFSLSKDSKSLMLLPLLLLLMILLVWRLPTLVYPPRAWPLGDGILTTVYLYLLFLVVRSIQFLFYLCGVSEAKCVFSLLSSCVVVKRSFCGGFFYSKKIKEQLIFDEEFVKTSLLRPPHPFTHFYKHHFFTHARVHTHTKHKTQNKRTHKCFK